MVDSTLQLSIAAIYAGRTSAMDCGVVPVQVDEVTIWPPTKEQLETQKATAYAWVDRRGIRSFENSVQMTAADGKMVMEIINVRTTSCLDPLKERICSQQQVGGSTRAHPHRNGRSDRSTSHSLRAILKS